jgi:hypothetical protein
MSQARDALVALFGGRPTQFSAKEYVNSFVPQCKTRSINEIVLTPEGYEMLISELGLNPNAPLRKYKGIPLVILGYKTVTDYVHRS